jgi:hypothetical protein
MCDEKEDKFAVKIAVFVRFYFYVVRAKQDLEGVDGAIVVDVRSVLGLYHNLTSL